MPLPAIGSNHDMGFQNPARPHEGKSLWHGIQERHLALYASRGETVSTGAASQRIRQPSNTPTLGVYHCRRRKRTTPLLVNACPHHEDIRPDWHERVARPNVSCGPYRLLHILWLSGAYRGKNVVALSSLAARPAGEPGEARLQLVTSHLTTSAILLPQ